MRLKEPLQGVKLVSQLHPIIHAALCVGAFFADSDLTITKSTDTLQPELYTEADVQLRDLVVLFKWAHGIEAIAQVSVIALKQLGMHHHSQVFSFLCNLVLYVCPVYYGAFLLSYYYDLVCKWDTPYAKWVFLEV